MESTKLSDLEETIIYLVKEKKKNLTYKQIKRLLHISTEEKINELNEALKNLEVNGYLYLNDYDEYQLFTKCKDLAIGELKYNNKNKPYILVGNNAVFIPTSHLNGAIPGDLVIIKRSNYKIQGNSRGEVEKILRRDSELLFDYKDGNFEPYNWETEVKIHIPEEQKKKLINGSRVLVKISLEKTGDNYNGQIISLVGHKDDPELDVKTMASKNGVKIDFTEEAMEQANSVNYEVTQDEIDERIKNGGLDLRNKCIFTIDGDNTKDIDDAVSIEKLSNGNYLLGVHIADVSHYIPEDSTLDLEARDRSTSVYPYNCVIPMLPHILSNGICSLNPNEDRLALSCIMEINPKGVIVNYDIVDTIINSKKKMSYEKINDIFEKHIMHDDYKDFIHDLALMSELSAILEQKKISRGFISFGDDEMEFENENGETINIYTRKRGMAEKMIENFMLVANETTSSFYYWLNMPGIYRNHPSPNVESIKEIVRLLGLRIHVPSNADNPRVLQNILNKIKKFDEDNIYGELLLLSMKRAYYGTQNIGHFGLALGNYTHFTSPIRRYPDLMTHRIIRRVRDNIMDINHDDLLEKLNEICRNSSIKERIADKTEREINHYKAIEYLEGHIGEIFNGHIQYISKSGITIKTEQCIYGKISMDNLRELGFHFNEKNLTMINNNQNITLYIGDKISLQVMDANKETGKIEFSLIEKLEKNKQKVKAI